MEPEEVWDRFLKTRDIAWAGSMVYLMARKLKEDVLSFLNKKKRVEKVQASRGREKAALKEAKLTPVMARLPARPPSLSDLIKAFRWVEKRVIKILSVPIARISRWSLHNEIERVRKALSGLKGKEVSFFSLVRGRDEIAPTLISLLYLERQGEVELYQERPFADILIKVKSVDRQGGPEEAP